MNANYRILAIALLMAVAASATGVAAQTCSNNFGLSPRVCVDWSQGADPVEGIHFEFDFETDAANPGVILLSGDLGWVVFSQVSDTDSTPDNLGAVKLNPTVSTDNFEVTIANGSGAGANSVGSLDLKPTSWTGHSSIDGGHITGDLTGDLILKPGVSGGGEISGDFVSPGSQTDFAGDLILRSGIPWNIFVVVNGALTADASIDLKGEDMSGTLSLMGGSGDILNGGTITDNARVFLIASPTGIPFSGDATFSAVDSFGWLRTEGGAVSGTVRVTGDVDGFFLLADGDPLSSGSMVIDGDLAGGVGASQQNGGFDGDVAGSIIVKGAVTSDGEITVRGVLSGLVRVDGKVSGDIVIDIDVSPAGAIDIGGLAGGGRILIDGVCDGDITLDEGSTNTSLIHIEDGFDGSIVTGTDAGSFTFAGDMLFGLVSAPITLPDYSFLGCVDIDGDLDGDAETVGCLNADPSICVGGDTNGTITLTQTGCSPTYVLDDSCSACP